jgi:hypothetical protein
VPSLRQQGFGLGKAGSNVLVKGVSTESAALEAHRQFNVRDDRERPSCGPAWREENTNF